MKMRFQIDLVDDDDDIGDGRYDKEKVNEEPDRKGVNDDAVQLLKSAPVSTKITNDD